MPNTTAPARLNLNTRLVPYLIAGAIALSGIAYCSEKSVVKTGKDLTGDGIHDILVKPSMFNTGSNDFLLVGQPDGSFIKATEMLQNDGSAFVTDSGKTYTLENNTYEK